jgi:3-deoxy-alpha-D-manno-octulosonate 8-oxidase
VKFKNVPNVPRMAFGNGFLSGLPLILDKQRQPGSSRCVLAVDENVYPMIAHRIPVTDDDVIIQLDTRKEPHYTYIDTLVSSLKEHRQSICAIVGVGGGSAMDIAKCIALLLTNDGSAADYQGWDLVRRPGIFHVGVPTIAGSGAEASRTAVITGPVRKLGLNSDFTPFDQVIIDPTLCASVPKDQRFFTGMDCYIHAVEALHGYYGNSYSEGLGKASLDLCVKAFMESDEKSDEHLCAASYMGGLRVSPRSFAFLA